MGTLIHQLPIAMPSALGFGFWDFGFGIFRATVGGLSLRVESPL
jgi:hypothetical protein